MSRRFDIDHLVVLVPDISKVEAALGAAGFRVTPVSRHSDAMGTANVCVMLGNSYLEFMGIVADTEANAGWRALLAEGPGVRGVAFASRDIDVTESDLAARGIAGEPVRQFTRATPDGDLRFSVIRIPRGTTPGLQCLYCQQHTADLLWQPHLLQHSNGARRLAAASLRGVEALAPFASDGPDAVALEDGPSAIGVTDLRMPPPAALGALRAAAGIELYRI